MTSAGKKMDTNPAPQFKAEEAGEEAPIGPWLCRQRGTNPVQFVLNILQSDRVDPKNNVKYTPGGVLRIHELTCPHLPPNGILQFTLATFGNVAIPVHHC